MRRQLTRTLAKLVYPVVKCGSEIRILCYHGVTDDRTYLNVTPADFNAQMSFLAEHGYRTISISDFLGAVHQRFSAKSIIITFDDGYVDNYVSAFPIMRAYGFTGTVFCTTGSIAKHNYLTHQQILEMYSHGWEFGSHTVSHPHLPQVATELKRLELAESRQALATIIDGSVDFFCYPYGEYDQETIKQLAELGYRAACSNRPGANGLAAVENPYLLRRTEIGGFDTLEDFRLKLGGAFDLFHQILHTVRGRP
ncbi:polysaccharide deacetylase family protein [Geobacter argillaceus]|uniref:Polysaccharide deacetylase n=1 Tax=Geobacter argillaceus TaxID=345631 RepID=A0A562VHW9_9BACT|nr:polysaccharide deacetylase family protein [Geobacter argillaceus]TWJ17317.1 polysaccharide deacetylase [Geobacter argillaceus]